MRAWSVLRQLLAATLCAVLALPASSTVPLSSSRSNHAYDAAMLSKTRVGGSDGKMLHYFSATLQLSEKQHWGWENSSEKIAVGSGVTYDYDAFGNLPHSTANGIPPGGTTVTATPNEFLFAGEQFDSDLNLYYNRARYLNTFTGRFWSMDTYQGDAESPLSLHKYRYGSGDPVDNIDPSGLQDLPEFNVAGAISQALDATIFTVLISAGIVYKTLHDLPPNPFISSKPTGIVAGFQITKSAAFLGELGLFGASVGGDIVLPFGKPELWAYLFVTPFSAKFNIGVGASVDSGLQGSKSVYVGAVWDANQPSAYKGPFFCSTFTQALFGPLPPWLPYRPDLTVCSSQQDNGKPGAYTLTFAPADVGTEQVGAYFSYYLNPVVISLRDLARALPGPIPFPIPAISLPPIPLPDPLF